MLDLIIVTGASRGIGANIAKKCTSICKKMIIVSSSPDIYDINIYNAMPLQIDLSDYNIVKQKMAAVINSLNNIESIGIVLCGAQLGESGGLLTANLDDWNKLYKCNVLGNLAVIQSCNSLINNIKIRVVFFAGGGAAYGYPEFSGYALSKVAVVRSVENLGIEFDNLKIDASIVALAPGAVNTSMLAKIIANKGKIKTKTDITESANFVIKFLNDELNSKELNGRFLHVRDDLEKIDFNNENICKLRRVE